MLKADKHAEIYAQLLDALGVPRSLDSAEKSRQSDYPGNRRRHARHYVGRKCSYRVVSQAGFGLAMLHDISESGLAITCHQKIDLDQPLSILLETQTSDPLPWIIRATVVRITRMADDGIYRYGCQIKHIINPKSCVNATGTKLERAA